MLRELQNCLECTKKYICPPYIVALNFTATLFIAKPMKSVTPCVKMWEKLLGLALHQGFSLPMRQKA